MGISLSNIRLALVAFNPHLLIHGRLCFTSFKSYAGRELSNATALEHTFSTIPTKTALWQVPYMLVVPFRRDMRFNLVYTRLITLSEGSDHWPFHTVGNSNTTVGVN